MKVSQTLQFKSRCRGRGHMYSGNSCSFVYVLLCCISLILNVYLYPLVFLFNLFSLLKISFLASLKVKILVFVCCSRPCSLALDVCRLHPLPEKFSRLLKTVGIGREKGREVSVLSQLLFYVFHLRNQKQESDPVVLLQSQDS